MRDPLMVLAIGKSRGAESCRRSQKVAAPSTAPSPTLFLFLSCAFVSCCDRTLVDTTVGGEDSSSASCRVVAVVWKATQKRAQDILFTSIASI